MSEKSFVRSVVLDEEKNILLLKRIDRKSREPVKGGCEPGETATEGILRELLEETSLHTNDVNDITDLGESIVEIDNRGSFKTHSFIITVSGTKPQIAVNHIEEGGIDHNDYRWVTYGDLEDIELDIISEQHLKKICSDIFSL